MKPTIQTPAARRKIRDRVKATIEPCADGSVRYDVVFDDNYYESGFRGYWSDALARVGSIMHELAERNPEPTQ